MTKVTLPVEMQIICAKCKCEAFKVLAWPPPGKAAWGTILPPGCYSMKYIECIACGEQFFCSDTFLKQ